MRRALAIWAAIAACGQAGCAAPHNGPAATAGNPAARGVEDPLAFVRGVYDAYRRDPDSAPEYPAYAYSSRLRLLFDA